jgi:endonuclease/exonuclease/phosphatase family metal-dependent hydrolase
VVLPRAEPWSALGCGYNVTLFVRNLAVRPASGIKGFYFSCNPSVINVLSYNVRMLPDTAWVGLAAASYVPEGQPGHVDSSELEPMCREETDPGLRTACLVFRRDERADAIAQHPDMKDHDVVILEEAFSDRHRGRIVQGLTSMGYRYHSRILGSDRFLEQDGGVIILSRWPIQCTAQRLFGDTCSGMDCYADKGVLHAIVNKEGQRYDIFGTHLNNGDMNVIRDQLYILKKFVDALAIPRHDAVVIAGDFNINFNRDDRHNPFYFEMLRTLDAEHPPQADGQYPESTVVGSTSYLDYVLYSKGHLKPVAATNRVLKPKDAKGDLSDHYAVEGTLCLSPGDCVGGVLEPR